MSYTQPTAEERERIAQMQALGHRRDDDFAACHAGRFHDLNFGELPRLQLPTQHEADA